MRNLLKIFIHFLFWIVFVLFNLVFSIAPKPGNWPSVQDLPPHFFINLVWAATVFYLFYFFVIKLFEKRQMVAYLIISVAAGIASTIVFLTIHKLVNQRFDVLDYRIFMPPIAGSFIIAQCGSLVRGFENWFATIKYKAEIENKNLRNELELLKAQINPHFLFNTLNNIDSLIRKSPDDASQTLIKLSGMLRYMIYETRSELVPFDNEVNYINNYIQLQQLRFRNPHYIKYSVTNACGSVQIAPLLFIPFIENAFKHSSDTGNNPVIDIKLECSESAISFRCSNYYSLENTTIERTGGVGLENVTRRLELLYKGKHKLNISKEDRIFKVELRIEL